MKKTLTLLAMLGLISLGGCAWLGFGDDESTTTQTQEAQAASDESAPVQVAQASPAKPLTKAEQRIKAELDQKAQKLVNQSARTLLPNVNHKEVKKVGSHWVATFMNVDTKNISTEMRPSSKKGQYVGIIRYREQIMECRGDSKSAALAAPCSQVGARRLTEMIAYDGKEWKD